MVTWAQGSAPSLKGRYKLVYPMVGELTATTIPEISRTTLCQVIQSMPKITPMPSKLMAIRCVGKVLLPNPKGTPRIKVLEEIFPPGVTIL
jgi:hypothetical protein